MRRKTEGWFASKAPLVGLFFVLVGSRAQAEHCHPDAPSETPGRTKLGAKSEFASFEQKSYSGNFEGLSLALGHDFESFSLSLEAPVYRLSRNGEIVSGVGDVLVALGAPLPFEGLEKQLGVALHTSLPTGNPTKGLGMGHVMFMPSVWLHLSEDPFTFDLSLGGGFALMNAGGSHADHGPRPIVNPMNGQELTFQFTPRYALSDDVRFKLRATGAYPLASGGEPRLLGGVGVEFPLERFFSNVEISTALIGDPYSEKLSVGLGGIF